MLNLKVVTWALGIRAVFPLVFCVAYGLVTEGASRMIAIGLETYRLWWDETQETMFPALFR